MNSVPLSKPYIPSHAIQALEKCLQSGWLGYGPACHTLEKSFTKMHDGWAIATSSCTSALYLAAQLLKCPEKDEVIIPAITFTSTAMAFLSAGYKVRLADVDPRNLCLDQEKTKALISKRTRAIVVVHLYGQHIDVNHLVKLCRENNIMLIEDYAHRLTILDNHAPLGDFACYSFNAVKEAPGGEGGLIWSRHEEYYPTAQTISNVGLGVDTWQRSEILKHKHYEFSKNIGLKLRLNDIAATLINCSIECLSETREKRKHIFSQFDNALKSSSDIENIQRHEGDSYLMYVVKLSARINRNIFRDSLAHLGIATSVHYPSLSQHLAINSNFSEVENADILSEKVLTLPCFPSMSTWQIDEVINAVTTTMEKYEGVS